MKSENNKDKKLMTSEKDCFVGVDWGKKKVGLAIGDSEVRIASAIKEIETKNLFSVLSDLRNEYDFDLVVLGYAEEKGFVDNKKELIDFERRLKKEGFRVERENEAFSTKLAQVNLKTTGKKRISSSDNAESARIILQSWLDRQGQV